MQSSLLFESFAFSSPFPLFRLFSQKLAKFAKSARAASNDSDSHRCEPNTEAVESVMQNASVSRSAAVQALLENFNEPLTAAVVRQPLNAINITMHACDPFHSLFASFA